MRTPTKACILFILSFLVILSMPFLVSGEDFAVYGNETNVSYPAYGVNCSFGQIHAGQTAYWCWINFEAKVMDHSFMSFEAMDSYYNSSGDSVIIEPGDTYTLSAYQDQDSSISSGPGLLSSFIALIQSFF